MTSIDREEEVQEHYTVKILKIQESYKVYGLNYLKVS